MGEKLYCLRGGEGEGTVSKQYSLTSSLTPKEEIRFRAKNMFLGTVLIEFSTCRKGSYAGISLEIFFLPRI